jgi:hypothetical protein
MYQPKKASMDCVKRFPALYKMQALQVIDREVRDAISITADTFVMAAILVLAEHFGFGTSEGSTRIPKFVEELQNTVDLGAEYYDDAVAEGLRNRLRNLGICYDGGLK